MAATEEELSALTNEKIQKQAEQSTETISSLQDQLAKVSYYYCLTTKSYVIFFSLAPHPA